MLVVPQVKNAKKETEEFLMKKTAVTVIALLLALSLTACGGVQTNNEPAQNPLAESIQKNNAEPLPIEVKEYGYSMVHNKYVYYSVILHNPNEDLAIEFPAFRITARDESGAPIASGDQTLSIIYPKQDFVYASQAFDVDEQPASVDIEMLAVKEYNVKKASMLTHPKYIPLTIKNASFRNDHIVGEIQNDNDYDLDSGIVTAIFRDNAGKMVGGRSTFVNSIKANSATPFDLSISGDFVFENFEVYANIW